MSARLRNPKVAVSYSNGKTRSSTRNPSPVKRTIECVELSSDEDVSSGNGNSDCDLKVANAIAKEFVKKSPRVGLPAVAAIKTPLKTRNAQSSKRINGGPNVRAVESIKDKTPAKKSKQVGECKAKNSVAKTSVTSSKVLPDEESGPPHPSDFMTRDAYYDILGVESKFLIKKEEKFSNRGLDALSIEDRRHIILADNKRTRRINIIGTTKRAFPRSAAVDLTSSFGRLVLSKIPGAVVDPLAAHIKNTELLGYSELWPSEEFKRSIMKKRHSEVNIITIKEAAPAKRDPGYYYFKWQEDLPREKKRLEEERLEEIELEEKEKEKEELLKKQAEAKKKELDDRQKWQCRTIACHVEIEDKLKVSKCPTRSCKALIVPSHQKRCPDCGKSVARK